MLINNDETWYNTWIVYFGNFTPPPPFSPRNIHRPLGLLWPWSYGSWIYNYLCNLCLSPLILWVWILIRASCTTLCDKVCQWLATGRWFSPGPPVSSTNKTDCHNITEILLKVALNTIKQTKTKIHRPYPEKWFILVKIIPLTHFTLIYPFSFFLMLSNFIP